MDTPNTLPGGVLATVVASRQNALAIAHKRALEASRSKVVSAGALVRWARDEKASVRRG